jgi:hypothetical protein
VLEIQRDTALVSVDLGEAVALAVAERSHGPRVVAVRQPFYLDHIRPEVAQDHGRVRAGQHPGEVKDGNAGEWQRHVRSSISITVIVMRHGRLRQVRPQLKQLESADG